MKKTVTTICIIAVAVLPNIDARNVNPGGRMSDAKCFGFTVIEAGKGLNCKGDTVRLIKTNGYYQLHATL